MSDFIAGLCVGICQVAIGHPFDTTTVLIQNKRKWFNLPFKNYYRGWRFPMVSATLVNSTVFPVYERSLEYTHNKTLSGAISGVCIAPILYSFEVGKIRHQTSQRFHPNMLLKSRGKLALLSRETLAMSTYFTMYNFVKTEYNMPPLIAGGLAGLANWTLTYPIDVVKSRQIAQQITIRDAIKMGKLFRGYPVCAVRAILVNGVNFWTYETVRAFLDSK